MNGPGPSKFVSASGKVRMTIDSFHDDQARAVMRELIELADAIRPLAEQCLAEWDAEDQGR